MLKYIRDELVSMTDKGNYQTFTSSLIPGCNNIIGVRQPALKKYAKQLVKENDDFRKLLTEPDLYYEETLLRGYIIGMGTAKEKDFDKALEDLKKFIPLIDNWAVNDGFCVEFRIMDKYRQEFLPFLEKCILSEDEFEARAGLIMLLDHYIKVDADGNKKPRMKKVVLEDIGMCGENNKKEEQETLYRSELADYEEQIQKAILKERHVEEEPRGLMHYFDGNRQVAAKVISAFPKVQNIRGELFGVLECSICQPLTQNEIYELKNYWDGQMSDGWGEGFEQRPIYTQEGELYVSFWTQERHWGVMTEEELDRIWNHGMTQTL